MINFGTLFATLKLRDKLTPALRKAEQSLKKTGQRLTAVGAKMQSAGSSLTMGLTAPIVGMGVAAGVAFGSFEKSMNRVKALTGATGNAFKMLEQQAKDLGKTTQFSAGEAADAMGFLGMAGFKTTEIYGAMPSVLQLAAAATLDIASAADITSNILTGFGQTTEDLAHTNNVLVKAFTSANTDLTQLGVAFKYAGPVAKSAGLSFESTAAAIALMGNAGIQGSMAGTSLRGAITKLLGPSGKARKVIRGLGLDVTDASGHIRPMDEIVQQLGASSVTTEQLITIFGQRAGPAMAALVSQGSIELRKMTKDLENVGEIAEEIAEIQMQGLAGTFIRLKSATEGALIEIGEKLAPALNDLLGLGIKLANFISDKLVPAFGNLSPGIQKVTIAVLGLTAALGPLLFIGGAASASFGAIATALGTTGILGTVKGLLGPIASLTLRLLTWKAAVVLALLSIKPLREFLFQLVQFILNVVIAAFKAFEMAVKGVAGFISGLVNEIIELIGLDHVEWIGNFIEGFKDLNTAISRFGETLEEKTTRELREAEEAAQALEEALGVANLEGTVEELDAALHKLGAAVGGNNIALEGVIKRAIDLKKAGEKLTPTLQFIVDEFYAKEKAATAAAAADKRQTDALDDAARAQEALTKSIAATVREMLQGAIPEGQRMLRVYEGLGRQLGTIATDDLKTLRDAFVEMMQTLQQNEKTIPVDLMQAWSRVQETLTQRLTDTTSAYQWLVTSVASKPIPTDSIENLTRHLEQIPVTMDDVKTKFQKLKDEVSKHLSGLNAIFKAAFEGGGGVNGAIKSFITGALEALLKKIPVVGEALSHFAGAFVAFGEKIFGIGRARSYKDLTDELLESRRQLQQTEAEALRDMQNNWRGAEEAAERYKIELESLGATYQAAKWSEETQQLADDWALLAMHGADVNTIAEKMAPTVQQMIEKYQEAGIQIPDSMKPIIATMIDLELLTDAEGNALTDMSSIEFATPLVDQIGSLVESVQLLVDTMTGQLMPEMDAINRFKFDDKTIRVSAEYDRIEGGMDIEGHQSGTRGKYIDFGSGTPVMLHGKERVMTESEGKAEAAGDTALLHELAGIRRDLKTMPVMIRDAIILSN